MFKKGDTVVRIRPSNYLTEGYLYTVVCAANGLVTIEGFEGQRFNDDCFKLYEQTNDAGESISEEHTGGSSSYYDLKLGSTTIKCLDIIEGLDMSYNEGNILKAVWRIAAAKQGKKKKGNNMHYDSEKIVFFGERLVEEHS